MRGGLRPRVNADGAGVRFVDASGATVVRYAGLKAWDAGGRTLPARMEATDGGGLLFVVDARDAVYPVTVDPIAQQAYLKASNTGAGDLFGIAVDASANTVVVGAPSEDSNATGANGNQADNTLVDAGAVYVFERVGGVWSQQAYLKASNSGSADLFGLSVDLAGNTLVVGAPGEGSAATGVGGNQADNSAVRSGAVYVFERAGQAWSQTAYLKASNTDAGDAFGDQVALSGSTLVVGARGEAGNASGVNGNQADNSEDEAGAVYVFERVSGVWSQQAYLKASNADGLDRFAYAVAISGDTLAVGAISEASNATGVNGNQADDSAGLSGAVYVFTRTAGVWSQQAYLKASNTGPGDFFGWAVELSGDLLVVGAPGESSNAAGIDGDQTDDSAVRSGAVYVFGRTGTVWSQQAYLKASNTGGSDFFGTSVALSGSSMVVCAFREASAATGVNGNQASNTAFDSGAAYVFERAAGTWSQQAYLKASNTAAGDQFCSAMAVAGNTLVSGALNEDSNATGVNGAQGNNNAANSGAAYVFSLASPARLGIFTQGSWFIDRNGDSGFDPATEISGWGSPGDIPVKGDWNGDGSRDLGVFSGGAWFIDSNGDGAFDPSTDIRGWGAPGWIPTPGDWNGDGVTDLGVLDPSTSTWFLDRNGDFAFDPATEIQGWGTPGDLPVVGDWDGDGRDSIGVFSGGTWFIDFAGDAAFNPATDIRGWGAAGWTPVVGDWNGDGASDLGAVNSASVWFRDMNGDFGFDPATDIAGWGSPGDIPVPADWDGDGDDDLGVFSGGTWFLDTNGNQAFDPATDIKGWGAAGWTPAPGNWR